MGRRCTVCGHPQRAEIDKLVTEGTGAYQRIAAEFGVSDRALRRHRERHLAKALAKAHQVTESRVTREVARRETARGIEALDLYGAVVEYHERARRLFDACDRWLTDPKRPGEYTLEPRASEIEVVYLECIGENKSGSPIFSARSATLQEMLDRVKGLGEQLQVRYKSADPRTLVLQAARLLQAQVQAISRILAARPPAGDEEQLARSPAWHKVQDQIAKALKPYPEALRAMLVYLRREDTQGAGEPVE